MASVSRINGFRPVKSVVGGPYTGQANLYFLPTTDATVVMVGDVVKLLGDARSPSGAPTITRAAATDQMLGVVTGFIFTGVGDVNNIPQVTNLNTPVYRAANVAAYALVADDPNTVFEAQCTGTLATADIGLNVSPTVVAGSTSSGASGESIDLSTKATTATLPFKLIGFPQRPDNNIGDAFVSAYVLPNNHVFQGGTGTTGT